MHLSIPIGMRCSIIHSPIIVYLRHRKPERSLKLLFSFPLVKYSIASPELTTSEMEG